MSITSKIVLSALLIGFTLPAMAQGSNGGAPAATAPIAHHKAPLVHKVAAPIDITKPVVAHPAVSVTKPDALKVEAPKVTVSTGIVKPVVPATLAPATVAPAVKVN